MLKIYVNDYLDITEQVVQVSDIRLAIDESLSIDNEIVLEINNKNNFLSLSNPSSLFYKKPLSNFYITIRNKSDLLLMKGNITEIDARENLTGNVTIKTENYSLDKIINKSYYYCTIYYLFLILEKEYGININFSDVSILNENVKGYMYSVKAVEDDTITVYDLLNNMAETLGIYIYLENGFVRCKNYNPKMEGYFQEINLNDLYDFNSQTCYDNIVNQFSVKYYLNEENPVNDVNDIGKDSTSIYGEKPVKDINGSQENQFIIMERIGAINSGENYVNRYKNSLVELTASMNSDYFWLYPIGELFLIDNNYYQLISKSLDVVGLKTEMLFKGF